MESDSSKMHVAESVMPDLEPMPPMSGARERLSLSDDDAEEIVTIRAPIAQLIGSA